MLKHPRILNINIAGLGAVLAIAAAAAFLGLRPGLDRARRITQLDAQHVAILAKLARAEVQRKAVQDRNEAAHTVLAELHGGLPRAGDLDTGIKRVVALAVNNGLQVDGIRPVAHRQREAWDEYQYEIKATGRFPKFHRFCRALETQADFVDVPSYTIEHHGPPGATTTTVTCAVRFYALPDLP